MLDLNNNQYDLKTLKTYIYSVSLVDILKTQKLTADFCIKYILNEDFQILESDQNITIDLVLLHQTHISKKELLNANNNIIVKQLKENRKRIDSFEDFETVANRSL
jgi:hypothetical protein